MLLLSLQFAELTLLYIIINPKISNIQSFHPSLIFPSFNPIFTSVLRVFAQIGGEISLLEHIFEGYFAT